MAGTDEGKSATGCKPSSCCAVLARKIPCYVSKLPCHFALDCACPLPIELPGFTDYKCIKLHSRKVTAVAFDPANSDALAYASYLTVVV